MKFKLKNLKFQRNITDDFFVFERYEGIEFLLIFGLFVLMYIDLDKETASKTP